MTVATLSALLLFGALMAVPAAMANDPWYFDSNGGSTQLCLHNGYENGQWTGEDGPCLPTNVNLCFLPTHDDC